MSYETQHPTADTPDTGSGSAPTPADLIETPNVTINGETFEYVPVTCRECQTLVDAQRVVLESECPACGLALDAKNADRAQSDEDGPASWFDYADGVGGGR